MPIGTELIQVYNSFLSVLPSSAQQFINFFLIVLLIVIYSVFIWKFYRFIARKNIIALNLNQYNRAQHPAMIKIVAALFYFLEYVLILPFLIFFWFAVFTLFLIFLTEDLSVNAILIISATIIASIRMVSYYSNDLAKDLAKMLPLTLLAIAITKPGFFNIERIINHLGELPEFFNAIAIYLIFIIIIEVILRLFELFFNLLGVGNEEVKEVK